MNIYDEYKQLNDPITELQTQIGALKDKLDQLKLTQKQILRKLGDENLFYRVTSIPFAKYFLKVLQEYNSGANKYLTPDEVKCLETVLKFTSLKFTLPLDVYQLLKGIRIKCYKQLVLPVLEKSYLPIAYGVVKGDYSEVERFTERKRDNARVAQYYDKYVDAHNKIRSDLSDALKEAGAHSWCSVDETCHRFKVCGTKSLEKYRDAFILTYTEGETAWQYIDYFQEKSVSCVSFD